MSQHDTLTLETTRAAFERYFLESRKSKGANRKPTFERFEDGTYKDDHTQRHWWTWQNAIATPAKAKQPCGMKYCPKWAKGENGAIYQESSFACGSCGYVGKHDTHPGCVDTPPAPAQPAQAAQSPYAWAVSGITTLFIGPHAEYDARQEAKHCGGTADAFPMFKEAQAAQQAMAQPIGHVVSYKPLEHTAVIEWYPAKNGVPPAGFNVGSKLYLPAAQQTSDDVAKDAARFTKDVPTEQGWYWHWNGDEECAPIPTSVLWSGTTKSCFVSRGQLGLDEAVYCDKYGGYWLKMTEPWGAIDAAMQADAKGGA